MEILEKRISKRKFYYLIGGGVVIGLTVGLLLFMFTSGMFAGDATHADTEASFANETLTVKITSMNDANNVSLYSSNNAGKEYIDSLSSSQSITLNANEYPKTTQFIVTSTTTENEKAISIYTVNYTAETPQVEDKLSD